MPDPAKDFLNAVLLGVPLDLGAENLGVDMGPQAFRYAGITEKLSQACITVNDSGNVPCPDRKNIRPDSSHMRYLREITDVCRETARLTGEAISSGNKVIVLGGDHSVSLGSISGASESVKNELGLIYLDAHGDMNTSETTLTGNIHGMHLASLMGFGDTRLRNILNANVKIAPQNLLHVGGSDFDQAELALIKRERLNTFTLFDLLCSNLSPLFAKIDELSARVPNIWVSLDLDVIDRMYAPGAGMPNAKGLTYREIASIAEYTGSHANVLGLDVVEYNPLQDVDQKTAELGIELIAKFFGKDYSWYTNYMIDSKIE